MNILEEINKKQGTFIILVICFSVAILIQLAIFFLCPLGYTGDENYWRLLRLTKSPVEWFNYAWGMAKAQGRIYHLLLLPILIFESIYVDNLWYKVFVIFMFFLYPVGFSLWISKLANSRIAWLVPIVFFSVIPLGFHHWPPHAYGTMSSMFGIVFLLRYLIMVLEESERRISYWFMQGVFCVVIMLNEYYLITSVICIIVETVALKKYSFQDNEKQLNRWNLIALLRQRINHFIPVFVSYSLYICFRVIYGSKYAGNQLDAFQSRSILNILSLMLKHIINGIVPSAFSFRSISEINDVWLIIIVMGSICSGIGICCVFKIFENRSNWWIPILWGILFIIGINFPLALVEKYHQWCDHGDCAYINSRFSLLGISALISGVLAKNVRWKKKWSIVLTFILAILFGFVFYANNLNIRNEFLNFENPRLFAKWYGCCIAENKCSSIPMDDVITSLSNSPFFSWDRKARDILLYYWDAYIKRVMTHCDAKGYNNLLLYNRIQFPLNRWVDFNNLSRDSKKYLIGGWSHPEKWGTWSEGKVSLLGIKVDATGRKNGEILELACNLAVFGDSQKVEITANGYYVAEMTLINRKTPSMVSVNIPIEYMLENGVFFIMFKYSYPRSPKSLGLSEDSRLLSIGLISCKVIPRFIN